MFLPAATKMIVPAVSEIVSIPKIISILKIVCIPEIISIPELQSGVSLVPHARDSWISAIGEWRDTIALRNSGHCVWARTRERTSIRINIRPPIGEGW